VDLMIEEPSSLDYKTYSILIVDDNLTNLGLLMNYLGDYGFEILVARNGIIGFERAK
jgi:CheY-like chemotaxis protein